MVALAMTTTTTTTISRTTTKRRLRTTSSSSAIRNDPEFSVIEETGDYIVVDKPAPLLVHPSVPGNPPTLLDGLQALLAFEVANGAALSIINRLDRETSGVVLVAKNKAAARQFGMAMQRREVEKRYVALVDGHPAVDQFEVDAPILRAGEVEQSPIWVRQRPHADGRPCHTKFEVVERGQFRGRPASLVRAFPLTGRMHQIRVHLQHAGHFVIGDKIYGPDSDCYLEIIETGWTKTLEEKLQLPRQALHCGRMAVPGVGEWIAPHPPEFTLDPIEA
jgi:23S rRNA pseudouridine1911/1915/1917 synthase